MASPTPAPAPLPPALWQAVAFEWLWVYRGIAPRVREWSDEILVPPGVFFVESGGVEIEAGGQRMKLAPGSMFLSAPGPRRQWFEENTRLLSVGFRCLWPDGQPVFSSGLNTAMPEMAGLKAATRQLFRAVHGKKTLVTYRDASTATPRPFAGWCQHEAAFRGWFAAYVAALEQMGIAPTARQGAQDRRMEALVRRLNEWPLDEALNLKRLETELNLSSRRIHQLLGAHLGTSAQVYLERRRFDHAQKRLTTEDTPLKEIAFGLGFKHPPHFTAWFKRLSGMTPTAYRAGCGLEGA